MLGAEGIKSTWRGQRHGCATGMGARERSSSRFLVEVQAGRSELVAEGGDRASPAAKGRKSQKQNGIHCTVMRTALVVTQGTWQGVSVRGRDFFRPSQLLLQQTDRSNKNKQDFNKVCGALLHSRAGRCALLRRQDKACSGDKRVFTFSRTHIHTLELCEMSIFGSPASQPPRAWCCRVGGSQSPSKGLLPG